jgi:hypothetical protein
MIIFNFLVDCFKRLNKDTRGQMLPFLAVIIIIIIALGTYSASLSLMYRDRLVVRDALDAAGTAGLAGASEYRTKYTFYYEYCTGTTWNCTASDPLTGECLDGYYSCDGYNTAESNLQGYIYVNQDLMRKLAKEYFVEYMALNGLYFTIIDWQDTNFKYDDRYLTVTKSRPNTGVNPPYWWPGEFNDSSPPGWTGAGYESRFVRFPRYAEFEIFVRVELKKPFGGLFGTDSTYTVSFRHSAYKEIK